MKTASVRDLRQDFARILAWVQAGEVVAITMRRRAVARLIPLPGRKPVKKPIPDLAARLAKVFGQRVIADKTMKAIADQNRGTL
jgi:antitoxin (DNA-binding transcriptional repressor) of toxin-antitoxin stability system